MIIKVAPDKEKAKSILQIVKSRQEAPKYLEKSSFSTIIAESYYEIIKELCTGIALTDGYKTIGENAHKELIDFVRKYKFEESEIEIIHDLRIRRNKSSYEGKPIEQIYLDNKRGDLLQAIKKLEILLEKKIK